jgi:transposase
MLCSPQQRRRGKLGDAGSLIESCKLHGVNPEAYLTDVLTKLVNNWPNSRLAELLPWGGAAAL